jgi:hypothetical protein
VLSDYGSRPEVGLTPTTVNVSTNIPSTGLVYVTIHLDYGLKDTDGWSRLADDVASNTSLISGELKIKEPQPYTFVSGISAGGASASLEDQVSSVNEFYGKFWDHTVTKNGNGRIVDTLLSIDEKKARSYRIESEAYFKKVCTMCGQLCSIEMDNKGKK